jgi:hypothetical protein
MRKRRLWAAALVESEHLPWAIELEHFTLAIESLS